MVSEITLAEIAAALAAKHRAPKGISLSERDQTLALFLSHCQGEYELVTVSRDVVDRGVQLTQAHKLRGCDALQLASALVANDALLSAGNAPLTFVAADNDLLNAASGAGLATENPLRYP